MSNESLIIPQRSRDIGDFMVGRYLPFRKKRMVGPFIFFDEMGPVDVAPNQNMDIDAHPHIGLSTLTYLFEGEMHHRDSLGSDQIIKPGAVNWMTAGVGCSHSERTPEYLRSKGFRQHGFQIWVALPLDKEKDAPSFSHIDADQLPTWKENDADFKLIAGKGFGHTSPVPVHSDLFLIEIKNERLFELTLNGQVQGEVGICVINGSIEVCGETIEEKNMAIAKNEICTVKINSNSHLFLFGGQPFEQERLIYWNFVASNQETIDQAKKAWEDKSFPQMDPSEGYVPLPGKN